MQKKKSAGVLMLLATAIAGGSYAISLDFSETNISGDTISGDTFIGGLLDEKAIAEAGLDIVCNLENIPNDMIQTCEEWNRDN